MIYLPEEKLANRRLAKLSMGMSMHTSIWITTGVIVAIFLLGALARAATGHHSHQHRENEQLTGWVILGSLILLTVVTPAISRSRGRAWLERLDLPLEIDGYLDALNTRKNFGVLVVEATWQGDASAEIAKPHCGTVEYGPGRVTITSPRLETAALSAQRAVPHNASMHRWFRRVCEDVLIPLNARHQLTSLTARRQA